jgi:hypothetical protein
MTGNEPRWGVIAVTVLAITFFIMLLALILPWRAHALPHYSQAYSKAQIRKAAAAYHASKRDLHDLFDIAKHESTYHNWSHSRSQCHGLFQLSRGMAHGHRWWDPLWNSRRAIRYMRGRYGSIHKAYLFRQRHGWY